MTERKEIISAVAEMGNRVTVADVVAKTGLPLANVSTELNLLASETDANLEVNETGDIFYCFPGHFKYLYFKRGLSRLLGFAGGRIFTVLYFLFRISFGLILIFSLICFFGIALIIQTLFAGITGTTEAVAYMWRDFLGLMGRLALTDLVHWGKKATQGNYLAPKKNARQGFLLNCYSFLFGEGDPNTGLEEERWKLIAQVIRLNEGVVLPEHLSPYTGKNPDDEKAVFAVLAKFNGMPHVSESGNLVFVFPSMRQRSEVASYGLLPAYVEEKPWSFSNLSKEHLRPVLGIGVLNFLMAIMACMVLVKPAKPLSSNFLFVFLAVYATLFLLIPFFRALILMRMNKKVASRNKLARDYEKRLGNPAKELVMRLEEAEEIRRAEMGPSAGQIVYTTSKDYLEQISDSDFREELRRKSL